MTTLLLLFLGYLLLGAIVTGLIIRFDGTSDNGQVALLISFWPIAGAFGLIGLLFVGLIWLARRIGGVR